MFTHKGDASVDICIQVERFWVDAKTMSDVPAEIESVMKTVGKKSKKNAAKKGESRKSKWNLTQRFQVGLVVIHFVFLFSIPFMCCPTL